jgi:hypothetical protein
MSASVIVVGPHAGDIIGSDHRAIQQAIDTLAQRGGGTVRLQPGQYTLENGVYLRDHVHLAGAGKATVLRKAPERYSRIACDLGYGHYDVAIAHPELFAVGMGVTIRDGNSCGFYETLATLTWQDGEWFGIDQMLNHDYLRAAESEVFTSFPLLCGHGVRDVRISDLVVDGNWPQNPHPLNPCRGGGVFFLAARDVAVRGVTVTNLNGDGISFQQCRNMRFEDCAVTESSGHGIHPGSGTIGGLIRNCTFQHNGGSGIKFCLRAQYIRCESCTSMGNRGHGVFMGGLDTNNALVRCTFRDNAQAGIYFTPTDAVIACHATLIAENQFIDNCREDSIAEIEIASAVRDVHVLDNTFQRANDLRPGAVLSLCATVESVVWCGNTVQGRFTDVALDAAAPEALHTQRPDVPLPVGPEAIPAHADRHLPPHVRDATQQEVLPS